MNLKESWIEEQAVNASALKNGKAIYQSGKFVKLYHSQDDTFYMGECSGSGSKNYITSADFQDASHPVFRCNCPSRQFPCKHSIALLYAIMKSKDFEICEIPEDIIKKRERLNKRNQPKDEVELQSDKPKKVKKTANKKRWNKQLEGLVVCETMLQDITRMGVAAFTNSNLKDYETIAKQMNDYYLPGIQRQITILIYEAKQALQVDAVYDGVIRQLLHLHQIVKKAKQYLNKKLNEEALTADDKIMEELIGHIWNLNELQEQGFYVENQELIQLGFRSYFHEALQEFVEEGFWYVHPKCEIHKTINIRPKKAAKYIKEDDSFLYKIIISVLYLYPGYGNQRLRYPDGFTSVEIDSQDYINIMAIAKTDYEQVIKEVKNQLKNPLAGNELAMILGYEEIRQQEDVFVMVDAFQNQLRLSPLEHTSLHALTTLPEAKLLQHQVALVIFSYDEKNNQLLAKPMSIISSEHIVRLLY